MGKIIGNNNSIPSRLLRLKDAARYLSLSPWKLRQLIYSGVIPFVQPEPGSPYLLDLRDLDHYVETNKHAIL
jgi:excisionase family DNA binding protein